jgi:hypothetical protein
LSGCSARLFAECRRPPAAGGIQSDLRRDVDAAAATNGVIGAPEVEVPMNIRLILTIVKARRLCRLIMENCRESGRLKLS